MIKECLVDPGLKGLFKYKEIVGSEWTTLRANVSVHQKNP